MPLLRLALLVALALQLAVAAPAGARAAAARADEGVPEWAYLEPFVDGSEVGDAPRWTSFSRAGRDTLVATTWYRAWNGRLLRMVVAYPRRRDGGRLPLVRVFHAAGGRAQCGRTFGNAPGRFRFVVACLDGVGRHVRGYTYGSPESIGDYARIGALLRERLPGLRIDRARQIAAGSSMGAQEALLFAARFPRLAQTVIAMDAIVDLPARFWRLPVERQRAIFAECEGTPATAPACFAERSPLNDAARLAASTSRLVLYWSSADAVSRADQLPALARAIHAASPERRFGVRIGTWRHGRAWPPARGNLEWLADAGLAPDEARLETRRPSATRLEVGPATDLATLPAYGS